MEVNTDILCIYFSFLVYQRNVQLLYEKLRTLIEAFTVLQSDSLSFVDKLTDKSKDQAPRIGLE